MCITSGGLTFWAGVVGTIAAFLPWLQGSSCGVSSPAGVQAKHVVGPCFRIGVEVWNLGGFLWKHSTGFWSEMPGVNWCTSRGTNESRWSRTSLCFCLCSSKLFKIINEKSTNKKSCFKIECVEKHKGSAKLKPKNIYPYLILLLFITVDNAAEWEVLPTKRDVSVCLLAKYLKSYRKNLIKLSKQSLCVQLQLISCGGRENWEYLCQGLTQTATFIRTNFEVLIGLSLNFTSLVSMCAKTDK